MNRKWRTCEYFPSGRIRMICALIHFNSHVALAPITSLVEYVAIPSSPRYGQETKIIQGIRIDEEMITM
jgi:hypothetical protein